MFILWVSPYGAICLCPYSQAVHNQTDAKAPGLQVVFAVRTDDKEDLKFLDILLARHSGVYRRSLPGNLDPKITPRHWQESYTIARPGQLYIKIDDDVIFIQV